MTGRQGVSGGAPAAIALRRSLCSRLRDDGRGKLKRSPLSVRPGRYLPHRHIHHPLTRGGPTNGVWSAASPKDDAARKLVYLALQNAVPQWTRTRNWTTALLAFKIHFGDRVPDTAS
jgi:hypothetical protein